MGDITERAWSGIHRNPLVVARPPNYATPIDRKSPHLVTKETFGLDSCLRKRTSVVVGYSSRRSLRGLRRLRLLLPGKFICEVCIKANFVCLFLKGSRGFLWESCFLVLTTVHTAIRGVKTAVLLGAL